MESFHRTVKELLKARQTDRVAAKEAMVEAKFSDKEQAAFDSEKRGSETNTVGIAKATATMEKRLGGSLGLPLPAEKFLKIMGDEMYSKLTWRMLRRMRQKKKEVNAVTFAP